MIWLAFSNELPDHDPGSGLAHQVHRFASYVGPIGVGVLSAFGVYFLGAIIDALVRIISQGVGRTLDRGRFSVIWIRYAHRKRAELETLLVETQKKITEFETKEGQGDASADANLRNQRSILNRTQEVLGAVRTVGWQNRLLVPSKKNRAAIGDPPAEGADLEERLIDRVRNQAVLEQLEVADLNADLDDVERVVFWRPEVLGREFRGELQEDPLDVLRALDVSLYLEMDRERGEREVRLAISLPLIAIGIVLAVRYNGWWSIVSIVAAIQLSASSIGSAAERRRVLKLIDVKGLQTPAVRAAATQGRMDVLEYKRRRRAMEEQERRASQRARDKQAPSSGVAEV